MSRPQLVLKQSTGWFAAGWQFAQALEELSDPAFKLYAWLCLRADRHTGQLRSTMPELATALKRPEAWVESAVGELAERGVCLRRGPELLEIADRYWPYERASRPAESSEYAGEVRRMLQVPACVRCRFSVADERLAEDLDRQGVSLEHLQRAIWLGCARKYVALLNGQSSAPITSLRYFIGVVEEVSQTQTPETYWEHVRSKAAQLEREWLERRRIPAAAPR
jgi:hypothetical protein